MNNVENFWNRLDDFCIFGGINDQSKGVYAAVGSPLTPEIEVATFEGVIKRVVNFQSLNYLGLGQHRLVQAIDIEVVKRYGLGQASSGTLLSSDAFMDFEQALINGNPYLSVALLPTGYGANVALMQLLARDSIHAVGGAIFERDYPVSIYVDMFSHASLQHPLEDMKRFIPNLTVKIFAHKNYKQLKRKLFLNTEGLRIIVSDTTSSMEGDQADIFKLHDIARESDSLLVLDMAHSFGLGYEHGGEYYLNPENFSQNVILTGTLSKVFCSNGGFIIFPSKYAGALPRYTVSSSIFSSALIPAVAYRCAKIVTDVLLTDVGKEQRKKLSNITSYFHQSLQEVGFDTAPSTTHIIPIHVGNEERCRKGQKFLFDEHGILVPAITPPAVSSGKCLFRISLTADHSEEHCKQLIHGLQEMEKKFPI